MGGRFIMYLNELHDYCTIIARLNHDLPDYANFMPILCQELQPVNVFRTARLSKYKL